MHLTHTMKNISPNIFAIVALAALSGIVLLPVDTLLIKMSLSDFQSEYIGLTIKMTIIFLLSYVIIKKMNIESIAGLSSKYRWKYKYLNSIPVYLILIGVIGMLSIDLTRINIGNLALLLFACLMVGFAEEFLFRGLLQSIFLRKYHALKHGVRTSILIPSLLFGLFHFINMTNNDNVLAVLVQVVFATFMGFIFGVLVLKTNKIIPIAITHGLINFFFSISFLPGLKITEEIEVSIAPIVLTLPLFIIGLFVVKKIKNEDVAKKLSESFN